MYDLEGMAGDLLDSSIEGVAVWASLCLLCFINNLLADGGLAQRVEVWTSDSFEISPPCIFIEQDPGAVLADDVQNLDYFFEVAIVVGGQGETDVTKVAIATLKILLALFADSSL